LGDTLRLEAVACMLPGMTWSNIHRQFPHQWLVLEALQARSELGKRYLDEMAVVDTCQDGESALRTYLKLHRDAPGRELYILHSDREQSDIAERFWLGLRAQ